MKPIRITIEYENGTILTLTPEEYFARLKPPCAQCGGYGLLNDGKYCSCKMGRDVERVSGKMRY